MFGKSRLRFEMFVVFFSRNDARGICNVTPCVTKCLIDLSVKFCVGDSGEI